MNRDEAQKKYDEYIDAVAEYMERHPDQRSGQAHFNVLYFQAFDPEFADQIRGEELDPFYKSSKVPEFIKALRRRWGLDV